MVIIDKRFMVLVTNVKYVTEKTSPWPYQFVYLLMFFISTFQKCDRNFIYLRNNIFSNNVIILVKVSR